MKTQYYEDDTLKATDKFPLSNLLLNLNSNSDLLEFSAFLLSLIAMLMINSTLQSFEKKICIFWSITPVHNSAPNAFSSTSMISLIKVFNGYLWILFLIFRLFFDRFLRRIMFEVDNGSWSFFLRIEGLINWYFGFTFNLG